MRTNGTAQPYRMLVATEGLAVDDRISLTLTRDQALVLFEWLARTGVAEKPVGFEDPSEQQVLWELKASLESVLTELFRDDYKALLAAARVRVIGDE